MTLRRKSVLLAAVRAGDVQVLSSILDTERVSLTADNMDFHMLKKSIQYGRTKVTEYLLSRGCRPSLPWFRGESPLHLVVSNRKNCLCLTKRLLDCGAKVDQRNRYDETVLHAAFSASADNRVIELLLKAHLKQSVVNESNDSGLSYLHMACAAAGLDCVRRLVESGGADVNAQVKIDCDSSYAGSTPLHMAVEFGQVEVVDYLLNQGAEVNVADSEGSTPVHLALELGETDIIAMLFDYDSERVNCVNSHGLSHFMAACACSNPDLAKEFLVDRFISDVTLHVNEAVACDKGYPLAGFTPLHFAAIFNRFETTRMLLADGANCCATTVCNMSPAQFASRNNYQDISDLIKAHCQGYDWFCTP